MYRLLGEASQVKKRRRLARHPARKVPEVVATGPGRVYTWGHHQTGWADQGDLLGRLRDCRHLHPLHLGAHVHARESGVLAEELMKEIFEIHGVPVVVHADRRTSMTSTTVAACSPTSASSGPTPAPA
jgi:putative transposase